jgi:hypothetical protein
LPLVGTWARAASAIKTEQDTNAKQLRRDLPINI